MLEQLSFIIDTCSFQTLLQNPQKETVSYLNWFDIMGDDNHLCFLLLDQGCYGVDPGPDDWWALGWYISLALSTLFSTGTKSFLLRLLGLGPVLVHQFEQLGSCNGE